MHVFLSVARYQAVLRPVPAHGPGVWDPGFNENRRASKNDELR